VRLLNSHLQTALGLHKVVPDPMPSVAIVVIRTTPLSPEVRDALRAWREENPGLGESDPIFPARGSRRAMSTDTAALRRALHARTATQSPHVLRHTCAMRLLAAGVDVATIALWLGQKSVESTSAYLHAAPN
jgi:integrase/recombinase XerD